MDPGCFIGQNTTFLCWMAQSQVFRSSNCKAFAFHASVPVLRNENESLQVLRMPSPPCLVYYSVVLLGANDRILKRDLTNCATGVPRLDVECVSSYFSLCYYDSISWKFHIASVQRDKYVSSAEQAYWALLEEYGIMGVLSCIDMISIRTLLALARSQEVNFDTDEGGKVSTQY